MESTWFRLLSCLLLSTTLLFIACNNDDDEMMEPTASMTCKLDGVDWSAAGAGASIINNTINVTGISAADQVITITLTGTTVGTYSLDPNLPNAVAYTESNDGTAIAFVSNQNIANMNYGEVVISEINMETMRLSGTFTTEVHRLSDGGDIIITEGIFNDIAFEETIPSSAFELSATIDGTVFDASVVSGLVSSGNLAITGSDAMGQESIGLTLPDDITPGTYSLGTPGLSSYGAQYNLDSSTFLSAESGTLTIEEHQVADKIIKGTFSFEASELAGSNTASITAGSFELTYQ